MELTFGFDVHPGSQRHEKHVGDAGAAGRCAQHIPFCPFDEHERFSITPPRLVQSP
jgi:hypothetical protein